jgi:hypothetical protein
MVGTLDEARQKEAAALKNTVKPEGVE